MDISGELVFTGVAYSLISKYPGLGEEGANYASAQSVFSGEIQPHSSNMKETAVASSLFSGSIFSTDRDTVFRAVASSTFRGSLEYDPSGEYPHPGVPYSQDVQLFDHYGYTVMVLPLLPVGIGDAPTCEIQHDYIGTEFQASSHLEQRKNLYSGIQRTYTFDYAVFPSELNSLFNIAENIDRFPVCVPIAMELYRFEYEISGEVTDFGITTEPEHHLLNSEYVVIVDTHTRWGEVKKVAHVEASATGGRIFLSGEIGDVAPCGRYGVFPALLGWCDTLDPEKLSKDLFRGSLVVKELISRNE